MLFRSGTGIADGDDRAVTAAKRAIASPLLEDSTIEGARGVLINITGNSQMTLHEVSEASQIVQEAAHPDAHIIFGSVCDDRLESKLKITVIATGFSEAKSPTQEQHSDNIDVLRPKLGQLGREADVDPFAEEEESARSDVFEIPAFLRRQNEK